MSIFLAQRREPLLDEASYNWSVRFKLDEGIPGYIDVRDAADTDPEARGAMRWHIAREKLAYSVLLYSGGERLVELIAPFMEALDAVEAHLTGEHPLMDDFDLAIQDSYVQALWLLSLTVLLGLGANQLRRVASLYAADETNDGADELFEALLAKLARPSHPAEGLIHEVPYQLLLDCIKAQPQDRPPLMAQFLKRWFKGQKECDWWGMHVNRTKEPILKTGFFGYWAFEAALVTHLWDIDDTSYRDLPHYPKDLVDYARQNAAAGQVQLATRVPGGERCPRAGWWFTPARAGSRQHFEEGQLMPEVGGDYGATIWQWDAKQD